MGSEPTAEDWEALSLRLEQATGYDSIPTIEGHYSTGTGTFRCVFPGCKFTRSNPYDLWRHVHFSANHGPSFGVSTTYDELCVLAEKLGASA